MLESGGLWKQTYPACATATKYQLDNCGRVMEEEFGDQPQNYAILKNVSS